VTTSSLVQVRVSNRKFQLRVVFSLVIQGPREIRHGAPARTTSVHTATHREKVIALPAVVRTAAPEPPSQRPPRPASIVEKRGSAISRRYIYELKNR